MNQEPSIQDLTFKITRKYQKSPQRMTNIKSIISVNKIYCGKTLTQFDAEVMIRANEKSPHKSPLRQLPKSVKSLVNTGTSVSLTRKNQNLTSSGMQTDNTISIQEQDFNYITWGSRLSKILDAERKQVNSGGPSILERMNYIRSNSPNRFKRNIQLKKQIQEADIKMREGLDGSIRLISETGDQRQSQQADVQGVDILNEQLTSNALSSYERKKQNLQKQSYGGNEQRNYELQWVQGNRAITDKQIENKSQQIDSEQFLQGQMIHQMDQQQNYNNTPEIKIVNAEIMDILYTNNTEGEEQQEEKESQKQLNEEQKENEKFDNNEERKQEKREQNTDINVAQSQNEKQEQGESCGFDDDTENVNTQVKQVNEQQINDNNAEQLSNNESENKNAQQDNLFCYNLISNNQEAQQSKELTNYSSDNFNKELNNIVHTTLKLEEHAIFQDDEDTCIYELNQEGVLQQQGNDIPEDSQNQKQLFKYVPTQQEIEEHSSQGYVSDIKEETDVTTDSYQLRTVQSQLAQLQNQIDNSMLSVSDPIAQRRSSDCQDSNEEQILE